MKIAIVGGGLGGFAAAIRLVQLGYEDITVFERDEGMSVRRQGYGLTILQGISAIRKLDLFDQVQRMDTPSRSHYIFRKDGSLMGFFGTIFWIESEKNCELKIKNNKKYNLHIERQELRQILLNRFIEVHPKGSEAIKWNHKIVNIDRINHSLTFSNGFVYENVDILVGADGIKGNCRSFKYPVDLPLNYLGIIVVLGITGSEHFLAFDRVFQTMDGCMRLFAMPFSKTRKEQNIMWQLSFPLELDRANYFSRDSSALKEFLIEKCSDWHKPIPELIKSTSVSLLMGITAYDRDVELPRDEGLHNPSLLPIALIGDSAHPMSPFKGQGANQALLDAVEFADLFESKQILKYENLAQLVHDYERKMIQRVKVKVMQSRERVETFHRPEALLSENFLYRGVDQSLLDTLNSKQINANWDEKSNDQTIEDAIMEHIKIKSSTEDKEKNLMP
jgi:salicylate hydroxylase